MNEIEQEQAPKPYPSVLNKIKVRSWIRRLYFLALVLFSFGAFQSFVAGAAIIIPGMCLHFYASGFLSKRVMLVTAGPYRFVRNPFYLSNLMIEAGLAVAAMNPYAFAIYAAIMFLMIIPMRTRAEEDYLANKFGIPYLQYQKDVPRIFPWKFGGLPATQGEFTMENLLHNGEIWRQLNLVGLFLVICASSIFRDAHFQSSPMLAYFVGGGAAAYIIGVVIRLAYRRSKKENEHGS